MSVTVGADGAKMATSAIGLATNSTVTALASATTSVDSSSSAATALTRVKSAISVVAGLRADVGAHMARYEAESSALAVQKDNISAARSRIADVDVAQESANFARQQILVQSGTAMLAQANVLPQSALRLIG